MDSLLMRRRAMMSTKKSGIAFINPIFDGTSSSFNAIGVVQKGYHNRTANLSSTWQMTCWDKSIFATSPNRAFNLEQATQLIATVSRTQGSSNSSVLCVVSEKCDDVTVAGNQINVTDMSAAYGIYVSGRVDFANDETGSKTIAVDIGSFQFKTECYISILFLNHKPGYYSVNKTNRIELM